MVTGNGLAPKPFSDRWLLAVLVLAGGLLLPSPLSAQLITAHSLDPSEVPETVDRMEYATLQARLQAGAPPVGAELAELPEPITILVEGLLAVLEGHLAEADLLLTPLVGGEGGPSNVAAAVVTQLRYGRGDFDRLAELVGEDPEIVSALRAGPPERFTDVPDPGSPRDETVVLGERGHIGLASRSGAWRGTFWFDSGAGLTVVSDSIAGLLGVEFLSNETVALSTSTELESQARIGVLPELEVGGVRMENHRVAVVPTSALRMVDSEQNWGTLHAILGWPALRRMRLTLDVPARTFAAALASDPASDSATVGDPNLTWMGFPLLRLTSSDGQRLLFGIDTGSWNTSLTDEGLRKLGLDVARRDTVDVTGVGGSQRLATDFADGVSLVITGSLFHLDNVAVEEDSGSDEVTFFQVDGVLGADVLLPSRLTLDFPARRFELAVPTPYTRSTGSLE